MNARNLSLLQTANLIVRARYHTLVLRASCVLRAGMISPHNLTLRQIIGIRFGWWYIGQIKRMLGEADRRPSEQLALASLPARMVRRRLIALHMRLLNFAMKQMDVT
ncbi:MAG: hypothetical protein WDN46_10780 [Methylocella sp.]